MEEQHVNEGTDSLQNIVEKMDRQLFYVKIIVGILLLFTTIFAVVAFLVIPPAIQSLNAAKEVMQVANATLEQATGAITAAEDALTNVTTMSDNIIETSTNLNQFVTDNAETMTTAMQQIEAVDFNGLNKAIKDLQAAVGPFANLMRKFK